MIGKNISLGWKLQGLNILLVVNLMVASGIGFWTTRKMEDFYHFSHDVELAGMRDLTLADMRHDRVKGSVYQALNAWRSNNSDELKLTRSDILEAKAEFQKLLTEFENLPLDSSILSELEALKPTVASYISSGAAVIDAMDRNNEKDIQASLSHFLKYFENLEGSLEGLSEKFQAVAQTRSKDAESFVSFADWLGVFALVAGLIIGLVIPYLLIRSITRTLNGAIETLSSEADIIRDSSVNIQNASSGLAQATTQQAAALQQTASSIEEMNAMVKKSTDNTQRSQQVSTESHTAAERGKKAVQEMIQAIEEINQNTDQVMNQTEESSRRMSEIVKVIQEIGNKTKIINDIVFQTKLLSFNASVEAARAGEHGKGFAVVAEEVGNLAAVSGNAAKEISDMLDESMRQVETTVAETKRQAERLVQEGKAKVNSGNVAARECGVILEEVVRNAAQVRELMQEVTTATQEQSMGIGEITQAMNQLDSITHQNAGTSRQVSDAASGLSHESESLTDIVGRLRAFVNGPKDLNANSLHETPQSAWATEVLTKQGSAEGPTSLRNIKVDRANRPAASKKESNARWEALPIPGKPLTGAAKSKLKATGTEDGLPSDSDDRFKDI